MKYDVCIIGSGAGAGPVMLELSKAGYKVVVLEKGPWFKTEDFSKDQMVVSRRSSYTSDLREEFHVIEKKSSKGEWEIKTTQQTGSTYWNGNCVGGSSNFMSAYFHRLKPNDFKLKSTYGPIDGADVEDWPISYDELEPYYTKVESEIGLSGKVEDHKFLEPRSTPDYVYPPLMSNPISDWYVEAGEKVGMKIVHAARGIISEPKGKRNACYYSNYCGSYGCSSNAKGSSRAALLDQALETGNCEIIPLAKVYHLDTENSGKVVRAHYYDSDDISHSIEANIFVVACQAVESSRLLLLSKNDDFPNGLANNSGNVGKNLIFAGGGAGSGMLNLNKIDEDLRAKIDTPMTFVNRACQDYYEIDDPEFGPKSKGETMDFLIEHSGPYAKVSAQRHDNGTLVYGSALKEKISDYFQNWKKLRFEIFCDWLPTDDCYVKLSDEHTDHWGDPVGHLKLGYHENDIKVGKYLAVKAAAVLTEMGLSDKKYTINGNPPRNLMAGGCRFGNDPKKSVLDKNCRAHEVPNLYVTDGSFMPTGGSVPHTFTIYANSFRVADKIIEQLKSEE